MLPRMIGTLTRGNQVHRRHLHLHQMSWSTPNSVIVVKTWKLGLSSWKQHLHSGHGNSSSDGSVCGKPFDTKDEIVISGMSGRFPKSDSIDEFKKNLLNGVDMITAQTRFNVSSTIPPRSGTVNGLDKFDANFFGVSEKRAPFMDPAARKTLEVVYETILDAGINPVSFQGSKTGVFLATDGADASSFWTLKEGADESGYSYLGTMNFLQPNQVSHYLDFKGPSLLLSTACSSSLYALETAVNSILSGACDRAIVTANSLHFCSHHAKMFNVLGAGAMNGESRPFDKDASGFVRSEAIVSLLLERKSVAKRNYASIKAIELSSDGMKSDGFFSPSGEAHEALYREVYAKAGIDPQSIHYLEAHGTGTRAGDPEELAGISNFFCKGRNPQKPLLIGTVKSNMGHSEAAAGLCGIAKVLISAQAGFIAPNLNFSQPNELAAHLFDGTIKVVTEKLPFNGGLIAVNSFGFGGTNSHLVLEPNCASSSSSSSSNKPSIPKLPSLVPFSGQTEESLKSSLDSACARAVDPEFTGLLHNIFKQQVPGYSHRGYGIIQNVKTEESSYEVSYTRTQKQESSQSRPIWFVFSGMGAQWPEMGKELMRNEVFNNSIRNSRATLKNAGLDLDQLLTPNNTSIFENFHHAACSIAAIQIALYDALVSLQVTPNGMFGHSTGEITCAYADGCLSAEEAILCVDARSRASEESKKLDAHGHGAMAAVGLSWSEAQRLCPPGLVPACNNGPQSVTISGHEEALHAFVSKLQDEGVFAKKVNSCGIASHSPLELSASKLSAKYLEEIISSGKWEEEERKRSTRWISTSIPEENWDSPLAQTASPEYFANNVIQPVLFYEATKHVPNNAVVIEIGPRGLLQSALRAALPTTCALVAPMQERVSDRALHFVSSIGDLYNAGVDVDFSALYPSVNFPVSAQVPSISPLVKWNHERSWTVPILENTEKYTDGKLNIDLSDQLFKYIEGHKLDDRLVFPATGYLHFAWRSFADSLGVEFQNLPVTFENVSFERAIFLNPEKPTHLRFSCCPGAGLFEINENGMTVTRGTIKSQADSGVPSQIFTESTSSHFNNLISSQNGQNYLKKQDIYKEFKIRGYNFQKDFQSIKRMDLEGKWAEVTWTGNWVTFLDAILQTTALNNLCRTTAVPVRLASLTINPAELFSYVNRPGAGDELDTVPVINKQHAGKILAPGIEINRVEADVIQRRSQSGHLAISQYAFIPYFDTAVAKRSVSQSEIEHIKWEELTLKRFLDIFLENTPQRHVQIYDIFTKQESFISPVVTKILAALPTHKARLTTLSTEAEISNLIESMESTAEGSPRTLGLDKIVRKETIKEVISELEAANLVLVDNVELVPDVAHILGDNAWIILRDATGQPLTHSSSKSKYDKIGLETIAQSDTENSLVLLLRKISAPTSSLIRSVCIDTDDFNWLPKLKSQVATDPKSSRIYIYSQNSGTSGIVGLVKCLRAEPGGDKLRCIFDPEGHLNLNFENPSEELVEIIEKDLAMNVVKKGSLGSYRHLPLPSNFLTSARKDVKHAFVNPLTIGDLSSLRWIESPLKLSAQSKGEKAQAQNLRSPQNVLCPVIFASLNFKDIMLSTGKLSQSSSYAQNAVETQIGLEFSGQDMEGNRIMGMVRNGLATSVLLDDCSMTWKVPLSWSLEEAATVPVVYATAYYALCDRGRLKPGQTVLIHSGTGGVGQAAINIALSFNCQIFTSVGTEEKRQKISTLFPSLAHDHICNSRDTSFEQQVLEMTQGRGVDLILNSLAEDKLQASLNCLAVGGTFSEIGRFDILRNNPLGMKHLGKNVDVSGVDLIPIFSNKIPGKSDLIKLVDEGIRSGVVKPLERTVFQKDQIEDAFRFMAAGKHMGKVLIQVRPEESNDTKAWGTVTAVARSYFDLQKTYVIIGGLGGLALEVANWLVERGANKLVLVSRSGVTNGYQKLCLQRWASEGVEVATPQVDLAAFHTAEKFLTDLLKSGTILGGIFNSSLVLKDALIENQTREMFEAVCTPKINITQNLDFLTRKHCPGLDYFVTFSSLSAGLGNAGQSNYGLANSAMEMICHKRKAEGLHGLAIQWGVVGDVGVVAEKMDEAQVLDGMNPQRISSCLEVLDALLEESITSPQACFSSMVVSEQVSDQKLVKKVSLTEAVHRLLSVKTPIKDMNISTTIGDLGVDSLTLSELEQLLEREFDVSLSSVKIRQLTWAELLAIEQGGSDSPASNNKAVPVQDKQVNNTAKYQELIKLQSGTFNGTGSRAKSLFIVHGGDGEAAALYTLASNLSWDVYGFDLGPKIIEKDAEIPLVQEMVQAYIEDIKLVQPEGPYNLAGYSLGGCIAFEMAQQLENKYQDKVENLIILDGHCLFGLVQKLGMRSAFEVSLSLGENVFGLVLSDQERNNFLENLDPIDIQKNHQLYDEYLKEKIDLTKAADLKLKKTYEKFTRLGVMVAQHTPGPTECFKGNVALIKANSSTLSAFFNSADHHFQEICQNCISIHTVPGDHRSFLTLGNVARTAEVVQNILDTAK